MPITTFVKHSFDWFVRDAHGKIVIGQLPNWLIYGWLVSAILEKVITNGSVYNLLHFLSAALLFTWAYLEVTKGDSRLRRLLGVVVIIALLLSHL